MANNIQRHTSLMEVFEHAGGALSVTKGLVNFFGNKVSSISNAKSLTKTEICLVSDYTRETYLTARILIICDSSVYGNLINDMGINYTVDQTNYPQNFLKIQNLLANWRQNDQKTTIPL